MRCLARGSASKRPFLSLPDVSLYWGVRGNGSAGRAGSRPDGVAGERSPVVKELEGELRISVREAGPRAEETLHPSPLSKARRKQGHRAEIQKRGPWRQTVGREE